MASPASKMSGSKDVADKAKQRVRALSFVQQHAGANAREASKTKWILELVMKADTHFSAELAQSQQQAAETQQQLAQSTAIAQQLHGKVEELQSRVRERGDALAAAQCALHTAQAQHSCMQESLACAEAAAAAAASECAALVAAVQLLVDQEARVRTCAAHKVHELRGALVQTTAALRAASDAGRQAQTQRERKLREREQALQAARGALLEQQAVHEARDDALQALQLRYHLSVQKITELLRAASQQADSAAAAIAGGQTAAAAAAAQPAHAPSPSAA